MSDEATRINRLMEAGRLSRREGQEILSALDRLERTDKGESIAADDNRKRAGHVKARFVRGEIGEEEFLATGRRASVQMGILFGALMLPFFVFMPVLIGRPFPGWVAMLSLGAPSGLISGVLFGFIMHLAVVRPATRRLAGLLREVETPMPPLQSPRAGQCPTCGAENALARDYRHWMMMHWILNPGLVINELILGQRLPAVLRECRECGTGFTDCKSCDSAIDGQHWAGKNAFGHWTGLHCPHCSRPLPCLRNGLAFLLSLPLKLCGSASKVTVSRDAKR